VQGFLIASIYLPNGNPQPGPKFDYKLAWFQRLITHAASLCRVDAPVVLAGDFNVVPTDRDIYPSQSWSKDALLQPESRSGAAVSVLEDWSLPVVDLWAVFPTGRQASAKARAFAWFIEQRISDGEFV
jgi:exodeoxyribonuclease-3